ncbi:MAG: hypothetical protein ABIG35_15910 [Pseudomonadota bacterium]
MSFKTLQVIQLREYGFSDLRVDSDSCFLCGSGSLPPTQEHVFPKWLQHRYNLWNKTLGLLNETKIQYKNLLIPCCARCNSEDLSRLEDRVSSAISRGFDCTSKLDSHLLYLWAGKLYFGVLRKEITLAQDRSRPHEGTILPKESLKAFSELHLFLQSIRGRHEFSGKPPYSVLVCNLHDLGQLRNFYFRDSLFHMTLSIRMGEVGIIVALEDGGLTSDSYGRYVNAVAGKKLHPIQFDELYAKVLYQVSRVEGGVTYITSKHEFDSQPAQTLVMAGGYLRESSQEEYSQLLRPMVSDWLHSEPDHIEWFVPPNLVPTWMTDKAGDLLLRPLSEWESSFAA